MSNITSLRGANGNEAISPYYLKIDYDYDYAHEHEII